MDENKTTQPTEDKPKHKLTPKEIFWIRFVLWTLFAAILPVAFIIWRFELFVKITKISIGGWGIIAILIIAIFAIDIMKYIKSGLKPSLTSQCISGFCKVVLPLFTLLLIVYCMRNNIDAFLQALSCVVACETVAVPLNPLPMWAYKNNLERKKEETEYVTDSIIGKFFEKVNEHKESSEK